MNLEAYANINDLADIAKENNIVVPRLRGYELMKDHYPCNIKLTKSERKKIEISCVESLCDSQWHPYYCYYTINNYTRSLKNRYLYGITMKGYGDSTYKEYTGVKWNKIHGKKRKVLKTFIHNEIKRQQRQSEVWNKYVGRNDVLYIHARIGGGNWLYYYKEVVNQPWFLEKVDDSYDSTYCDIYAKINKIE